MPYDLAWNDAFALEAQLLRHIFADVFIAAHHVGSTSVPGLAAKPVIDILLELRETRSVTRFDPHMVALGYRVRGECLDAEVPGTPGRFYYSKPAEGTRTHHVHACAEGHPDIADQLGFRDYLRAHPERAAAYAALKQRLAAEHSRDNIGYMRGKDAFIKTIIEETRRRLRA